MTPEERAAQQRKREVEERMAQERAASDRFKSDRLEQIITEGAVGTVWATGDRDEALAHRLKFVDIRTLNESEFAAVTNALTGFASYSERETIAKVLQRTGK